MSDGKPSRLGSLKQENRRFFIRFGRQTRHLTGGFVRNGLGTERNDSVPKPLLMPSLISWSLGTGRNDSVPKLLLPASDGGHRLGTGRNDSVPKPMLWAAETSSCLGTGRNDTAAKHACRGS